ncbi:MAG: glycoside hydrolase family 28 protein [Sedimentisphaerales bacterium]|nr:glycoside hydrolase family 28 protein [Sedimentisphaerales bacterium]
MKRRHFISLFALNAIALLICLGCQTAQAMKEHPNPDDTKPHIESPQNVMVPPLAVDDTSITLIWSKPEDYSNVVSYNVYQQGSLVVNTKKLFYTAKELIEPGEEYTFYVTAVNASGAESNPSNKIEVSTLPKMQVFDVTDYGAIGDGKTVDTIAIQRAIYACTKGGKVLIPEGKTFLSGALFLKSDITFQIDGTLQGIDDAPHYPLASTRFTYYMSGNNFMGLINAYTVNYGSLKNIRICGGGTVSGGSDRVGSIRGHQNTKLGDNQVKASYGDDSDRADMIVAKGVDGLYISGLKMVNPAMHTVFITYSRNITVEGIHVDTYDIHNADGVNLCTSETAYIFNSYFDTGDDCINFNAGVGANGVKENYSTKHVRVFNNICKRGHGGAVFGSFTAAWFQDFLIEDCVFDGTDRGLRFKTGLKQGGGAKNILCRDIVMKNIVKDAIFFDSTYDCKYPSGGAGQFKEIIVKNITCTNTKGYGIYINGSPGTEHDNITLQNITIDAAKKGGAYLKHCRNIKFNNVTIKNCKTNWAIDAETTSGLEFTKCNPKP